MHMTNNNLDFRGSERSVKLLKMEWPLWVETLYLERPVRVMHTPHQVVVEHIKCLLFIMASILSTIMFYHLDPIASSPLISTGMEVACVFIPSNSSSDFTALFPNHQLSMGDSAQKVHNDTSQIRFSRPQAMVFFHKIKEVDDYSTISFLLSDVRKGSPPCLNSRPSFL